MLEKIRSDALLELKRETERRCDLIFPVVEQIEALAQVITIHNKEIVALKNDGRYFCTDGELSKLRQYSDLHKMTSKIMKKSYQLRNLINQAKHAGAIPDVKLDKVWRNG